MDFPILLVSDESSTVTYRIIKNIDTTLKYIDGRTFYFTSVDVKCPDPDFLMTPDITTLVKKFRYGKFTRDWFDVAECIKIEDSPSSHCLPGTYQIFIVN